MPTTRHAVLAAALLLACPALAAPTVYLAVDKDAAQPVLDAFAAATGVAPNAVYLTARQLADRVRAEKGAPVADVLWTGEPFTLAALAADGLLAPIASSHADARPATLRDPDRRWIGLALQPRVFVHNAEFPPSIVVGTTWGPPGDMRDAWAPAFSKGGFVMARPDAGAAMGHVASFLTLWNDYEARRWAFQMKGQKVRLLDNDADVVLAVANAEALGGLCDRDDALAAQRRGLPVEFAPISHNRFDIAGEKTHDIGPVLFPLALAQSASAPNPEHAARLADFLLSPEAERLLARGPNRYIPSRPDVAAEFPELAVENAVTPDLSAVLRDMPAAISIFREAIPE